jgi:hypothetical protein
LRGYLRPEAWAPRSRTGGFGAGSVIELVSASGALVGKIRTDIENSSVISLTFDNNKRGGCTSFLLKLNRLPDFPILPFSIIKIKIADTDFNWFTGVVRSTPDLNVENKDYEYKGTGTADYLKGLNAFTVITGGQEIADIVRDLVQNWVVPFAPIGYNPSKIAAETGVITSNDFELGKYTLDKIFDTLADMGNCYWGVDGDNEFYFIVKTNTVQKTKFVSYDMLTFSPQRNVDDVINSIVVVRQESLGSGGVGWAVGGLFTNESSIARFGKREFPQPYQVPGYWSDADIAILGANLIAEKSEPKYSAKANGFPIQSENDYWTPGNYRFIMPFGRYIAVYSEADDLTNWAGTADSIALDTDFLVNGSSAIRIDWTAAAQTAILTEYLQAGLIEKIRFFVRSDVTGRVGQIGVGLTNYDENLTYLDIPVEQTYYPFEWDVSPLGLRKINKFGFVSSTTSGSIWLDKIEILCKGHAFYKVEYSRAKYNLTPNSISCDVEFGTLGTRMEDFFASLIAASKELKYTQEIR